MARATLTVIIITENEEHNIRRCLESIRFADEIIIVDSGSTDKTLEICREYTPHVFSQSWLGYGPQKQCALKKAHNEWVLSVDADEEVSPDLKEAIQQILNMPDTYDGFWIKSQLIFLGQKIKYAVGSDYHLRLFRRNAAHFTEHAVHEKVIVSGVTTKMKRKEARLYHYSFYSVEQMLFKLNRYTSLSAENKISSQKGKKDFFWRAMLAAQWMFFRLFVIKSGFLDGKAGYILARYAADSAYYRYIKAYYSIHTNSQK